MALGLREHFLLRDDVVFLNHGSFGACPRPIFEDYQFWQLELEKQPVEFMDQHRRSLKLIRNVREQLGAFVGSHPNNLVGVTNATTGLNIVARSLPLQEGDEILTTDHEYGALEKPGPSLLERRGQSTFMLMFRCHWLLPLNLLKPSGQKSQLKPRSSF